MAEERQKGEAFILLNDTLYTEEEFWDSARILIDYDEDEEEEEVDFEEEDPEVELTGISKQTVKKYVEE